MQKYNRLFGTLLKMQPAWVRPVYEYWGQATISAKLLVNAVIINSTQPRNKRGACLQEIGACLDRRGVFGSMITWSATWKIKIQSGFQDDGKKFCLLKGIGYDCSRLAALAPTHYPVEGRDRFFAGEAPDNQQYQCLWGGGGCHWVDPGAQRNGQTHCG